MKPDGELGKGMAYPALAGLERFDPASLQSLDRPPDASVKLHRDRRRRTALANRLSEI